MEAKLLEIPKGMVEVRTEIGENFYLKPTDVLEEYPIIKEVGIEKGTFQTIDGETYWLEIDIIHNQILEKTPVDELEDENDDVLNIDGQHGCY